MDVPETSVEIPIRVVLRVKERVLRKNIEICRLGYGPETNVTSLFGCCARRAIRLREAEKTRSLVSTESDESTPRKERYSGGGINGVYDLDFCLYATGSSNGSDCHQWWNAYIYVVENIRHQQWQRRVLVIVIGHKYHMKHGVLVVWRRRFKFYRGTAKPKLKS